MKRSDLLVFIFAALITPHRSWAGEPEEVFLSLTHQALPAKNTPSFVQTLTREDIDRAGARTLDEMLKDIPGAQVVRDATRGGFAGVRLRGVPSSSQVLIVVDDVPLNGVTGTSVDISQIPLQDVERIEIVRGGSSAAYGANAMGGIVHIITRRATKPIPHTDVSYDYGSRRTRQWGLGFGVGRKRSDFRVNAQRDLSDGFQRNQDFEGFSISAKGGLSFDNGARLNLYGSNWNNEVGTPNGTNVPYDQWNGHLEKEPVDPSSRVKNNRSTGRLSLDQPLPGGLLNLSAYTSQQFYRYLLSAGAPPASNITTRLWGGEARWTTLQYFSLGTAWQREMVDNTGIFGPPFRHHVAQVGLFADGRFTLGAFSLIPALRWDHFSTLGSAVNPRLTSVMSLSESWRATANVGRSVNLPSFYNLFVQDPTYGFHPNADLKPETAWTYDLGLERQSKVLQARATVHYTRLSDRIAQKGVPYVDYTVVNAPHAEIIGLETGLTLNQGPLRYEASYALTESQGNSLSESRYVPLALTPQHSISGQAVWSGPRGWSLIPSYRYVSKQFTLDNEKGAKLPPYSLWNLGLSKKILKADLTFSANNLFNRRYAENGYFTLNPQLGRNYVFSLRIGFDN